MLSVVVAALVQGVSGPGHADARARADFWPSARRGQVVVAGAGVDRARATARLGTAIPNPQVKYEHADLALTNTVEVIQPLWWLGSSGDTRSAGNASIRRARADSLRTRYTVAGEVMHAFYQVLAADQKLLLVRQQALAADTLLQLTTRRVALGDLSELERDQASQEVATVRLLERRSFEDARVSRLALARAMGVHLRPDAIITGRLAVFEPATSAATTLDAPLVVAAIEDSRGRRQPPERCALAPAAHSRPAPAVGVGRSA